MAHSAEIEIENLDDVLYKTQVLSVSVSIEYDNIGNGKTVVESDGLYEPSNDEISKRKALGSKNVYVATGGRWLHFLELLHVLLVIKRKMQRLQHAKT